MNILKAKRIRKKSRARRTRAKITGSAERPRLCVFRSNKHIYAQLINDEKGATVISCSDLDAKIAGKKSRIEAAKIAGRALADKCRQAKIEKAVFDKGGYKYHGIVKAIAEGAREGGLQF